MGMPSKRLSAVNDHYTVGRAAGDGAGSVTFQVATVSGTYTLAFEARVTAPSNGQDGPSAWFPVLAYPSDNATPVTTTTAPGVFRVIADGLDVRVRQTVAGPGSVDVWAATSQEAP